MRPLFALLLIGSTAFACPVGRSGPPKSKHVHVRAKRAPSSASLLPSALSREPWGGSDSKQWKPEAILANAASRALNEGWSAADVEDVLVSIPVKMKPSGLPEDRPYGDGQTNATLSFGWEEKEPQIVMTLIRRTTSRQIRFWVSSKIKSQIPMTSLKVGSVVVPLTKIEDGFVGTWTLPASFSFGTLDHPQVTWVKPNGWTSSFPMDFRFPVYRNAELLKAAGKAKTAGRSALDPLSIRESSKGKIVQDVLMQTSFGPEWIKNDKGGDFFEVENIHAKVAGRRTAVGGGHTWVIDRGAHSTFKNLYTCFDSRNYAIESVEGVPSGGGWHEIGDAAETIMNSVEDSAVLVGQATGVPFSSPDEFAYGLSDVATMRLLEPGEGLMTGAGDVTWEEDRPARESGNDWSKARRASDPSGRGRNYHWFAFASSEPTCTQEWVHICRPTSTNGFGLDPACK